MTTLAGRPGAPPEPVTRRRLSGWARPVIVVAIGIAILSVTTALTGQIQLTSTGSAPGTSPRSV